MVAQTRKEGSKSRYVIDWESSDAIAYLIRDIWIMSRVTVRSITQMKQAGTLAAPWDIHSHS